MDKETRYRDWTPKRSKSQHFTLEEIEVIREGYKAGVRPFLIARKLECSVRSVNVWYKRFRLDI